MKNTAFCRISTRKNSKKSWKTRGLAPRGAWYGSGAQNQNMGEPELHSLDKSSKIYLYIGLSECSILKFQASHQGLMPAISVTPINVSDLTTLFLSHTRLTRRAGNVYGKENATKAITRRAFWNRRYSCLDWFAEWYMYAFYQYAWVQHHKG